MPEKQITLSQARNYYSQIIQNDHSNAKPLKALLTGLVPESDPDRYAIMDQICRELTILTDEFEEFYSEHCQCGGNVVSLRQ